MPVLITSQTLKKISQVELLLYPDKYGTPGRLEDTAAERCFNLPL